MNFLTLAKNELRKLLSNRFSRIAILVVCGIPLLYSFLYLYAFWNPYGKLDKLPVAVVNEDAGGYSGNQYYNFGTRLTDSLRKNHSANWEFVSADQARNGLDHKKYYLAVKVPANFSENVLSVDSHHPAHANLEFIANEGSNYLASQIGNRIINEVKNNLSSQISQNYIKNIFAQVMTSSKGLAQASSGASHLSDAAAKAVSGNHQLAEGLQKARAANIQVAQGNTDLSKGATALSDGMHKTGVASNIMAEKTGQAKNGLEKINSGLQATKEGSAVLTEKLQQAANGENAITEGLQSAGAGAQKLSSGAVQANGGLQQISNGVGAVSDGLHKMNDSVNQGTGQLVQTNQQLINGTQNVADALHQYSTGLTSLRIGVNSSQQALKNVESSLQAYIVQHPEAATDPNLTVAVGTLQKVDSTDGLGAVNSGLEQGQAVLTGQIIPGIQQVNTGQQKLGNGISQLGGQINTALMGNNDQPAIVPSLKTMKNSLDSQIIPGINEIAQQTTKLADGTNALIKGTTQLQSGLNTASQKVSEIGMGASQMKAGNQSLTNGIQLLQNNLYQLSSAQSKLASGANRLNSGLEKSTEGLSKINQGLSTVETGQSKLGSGLKKIHSGAGELAGKLQSAAKQAQEETAPGVLDQKSNIIAQPVNLQDESIHKVSFYGSGFAPYFIPLSLWVGALMIFFVINPKAEQLPHGNKLQQALGKYTTVAAISSGQALVTSFVIRNVLQLAVTNALHFYLFNVLLSLVFVAIIQFFVTAFGIAGRFVGLVLLMLQLTSAGGTFPVELIPRLFQVLNPILPMSYGVAGLREIISGTNAALMPINIAVLVIFGLTFLGLTVFSYVSPLLSKLNLPNEVTA